MERKSEPHDLLVALLLVQNFMERRSEAFFQPYGLTAAQFNILNLLAYHDGRMDQAALVELLLVGKSSISIVLNRMVRDDLVKREIHPKDRRQVLVRITDKGRELVEGLKRGIVRNLQELFKDLTQEDVEAWLRIYRTIIRRSTQQHAAAKA